MGRLTLLFALAALAAPASAEAAKSRGGLDCDKSDCRATAKPPAPSAVRKAVPRARQSIPAIIDPTPSFLL